MPIAPTPTAGGDYGDVDYELEVDEELEEDLAPSRWAGVAIFGGAGIVGIVTLQVVMALAEGLTTGSGQRFAVPDDILHRVGYPFGSLGTPTILLMVIGVVLVALPVIMGEPVTDGQYRVAVLAMRATIVVAVVLGLGSILAVRGSLHEYTAKGVKVPGFVRVQFANFVLCTLAASAVAVVTAVTALRLRDEES